MWTTFTHWTHGSKEMEIRWLFIAITPATSTYSLVSMANGLGSWAIVHTELYSLKAMVFIIDYWNFTTIHSFTYQKACANNQYAELTMGQWVVGQVGQVGHGFWVGQVGRGSAHLTHRPTTYWSITNKNCFNKMFLFYCSKAVPVLILPWCNIILVLFGSGLSEW